MDDFEDDFERELKDDFLFDAQQLLSDCEQAFLKLEDEKENMDLINEIFRFAHNLKGTSRAVGFGGMAEFTHELEFLILKIKNGEMKVTDSVVSLLLESNDHVAYLVDELGKSHDAIVDSSAIIAKIQNIINNGPSDGATEEVVTPSTDTINPENTEAPIVGLEIKEGHQTISKHTVTEARPEEIAAPTESNAPESQNKTASKEAPKKAKQSSNSKPAEKDEDIRVALSKVELLNNYVGELVILQTVLSQRGQNHIQDELMKKSLHQLGKLSKEIQDISMSLRMVPLKTTMAKMTRIVRDTSKTLGKKVNLSLIGESTEIDKTVLEHLSDPLVHIVRNAIDHGLEALSGRIEAGKDVAGNITIKAFHEGNNLILEVIDDGKGIDPDIIRKKAQEKGIISNNDPMSDKEVINLIFHPGFSTKEQVTEVSGRGVGMDVVKTNIEKLSGQVVVTSTKGKGSVFRIQLPLTLAIIEAMIVQVSGHRFSIPFNQVSEFLRTNMSNVHFISGIGDCIELRGEMLPIVFIEEALGQKVNNYEHVQKTAIIVKSGQSHFVIMVDDIVNQQQVVIKKLGIELKGHPGFMGSAILGNGKPAIILDVIELFRDHKKVVAHNRSKSYQRAA
jgi:two-component system chemotaxis sensor kinase CheA